MLRLSSVVRSNNRSRCGAPSKPLALAFSGIVTFVAANASAQSYPLFCRGGGNGTGGVFMSVANSSDPIVNKCQVVMDFARTFLPGTEGEQYAFDQPQPGECRWKDRPFNPNEPSYLSYTYVKWDCNQFASNYLPFNINSGSVTLTNIYQETPLLQSWVWPLASDQSQSFTLLVHSDGSEIMVDQFLCS